MIYIFINFVPIAAATLLGLALGWLWLAVSRTAAPGVQAIAGAVLAEFWLAAILAGALILAPPEADPWTMAVGSAVVIWIGFVVPVLGVTFTACRFGHGLMLSAMLHWLAVMLGQAMLMQSIGLAPPPSS